MMDDSFHSQNRLVVKMQQLTCKAYPAAPIASFVAAAIWAPYLELLKFHIQVKINLL